MSDDNKRKPSSSEGRQTGVWLMLIALVGAILLSGYLMKTGSQRVHIRI